MKKCFLCALWLCSVVTMAEAYQAPVSVAGLFPTENDGREVLDFNLGWRFYRGDVVEGASIDFDDSAWPVVSVPHTVQLMPAEGSGSRNYQGKAWYRKRFVVDASLQGRLLQVYFEAVMGRANVYVNGRHALEHLGGYLPFSVQLNDFGIQAGDTCLIAVCADNSNDKTYPPGKPQYTLDFTYHGGIYRDVWLIAKQAIHITDPVVERHEVAGGGVFLHYDHISEQSATILVDTELANRSNRNQSVVLETWLCNDKGDLLKRQQSHVNLSSGNYRTVKQSFVLKHPSLWTPESPYLYQVKVFVRQGNQTLDGGMLRAGIRQAEFRGKDGFYLNGKPYRQLVGSNRHQDFAYVGNAVPNCQHWRDAFLLRQAGCNIVRSAHYPQDPAWMDACDELGIFMIVPTPGWQYWNKAPEFAQRVLDDVRQMIRRDRNHCSVLLWEPILNETRFPEDFSLNALQITRDEFPYPGAPLAVADRHSAGVAEHYGVVYGWPTDSGQVNQCIFTREFGENVDDWYAQNNNNRVSRSWGEGPMMVQAFSLADSYAAMFRAQPQFIGGAQWHSFDHQRGYHPDPYWGGIADCFRQPKYVYYLFQSQRPPYENHPIVPTEPMVYIAHEIMPFSSSDVTVFSNCDSVRLIIRGRDTLLQAVTHTTNGLPNEPVVFKGVYDFWKMREFSYLQKDWQSVSFEAEGIINGEVVCRSKKMPSRRSTKLSLRLDHAGQALQANGSDFAVVIAEVTDDNGNVRRLAKDNIFFTVEGEGRLIGDASIGANPRAVEFGSAPVLIQSTTKPGRIRVTARVLYEGQMAPSSASLEFETLPAQFKASYLDEFNDHSQQVGLLGTQTKVEKFTEQEEKRLIEEVSQQQADFGEKK